MREKKDIWIEAACVAVSFLIYFSLSCFLPIDLAPDEHMRYLVPDYIYRHHALPSGMDFEIIDAKLGFSYGFTPYLPSILSAVFMQLVSVVTKKEAALLVAARFVSVLAATGAEWLSFRLGRYLFEKRESRLLFAVCIGFLPQFVFLAAYLNNDAFTVFVVMLICYAWLYGKEHHWNNKACLFLAVGIGICALTYYNAYGWILFSVCYYFWTIWKDETITRKWYHAITHGCLIAGVVLLIAGWFFVRNAILYHGDFLGMNTMYALGEQYAMDGYKPSERKLFLDGSRSVWNMLWDMKWLKESTDSFFAVFGYMNIYAPGVFYIIYRVVAVTGLGGFLYGLCHKSAKKDDIPLYVCGFFCAVIPLALSIHYSYQIDYQPQGRYLMSALPVFALVLTQGIQWLDERLLKGKGKLVIAFCAVWFAMFVMIYITTMIPELYLGV